MSRSIHTTRRDIGELVKQDLSDPKAKAEALVEAMRQLKRKRRIKQQVSAERTLPAPPLTGTATATIPIEVLDEGPFVHHAASAEDIRAVLGALPKAAVEGITRIQLSLGKEYMDERTDDELGTRDPFTGRLSSTVFPGVYGGNFLGTYRQGTIWIYAYVYDNARLPLPRPLCEVYLRLHALKTLAHEVAHYHDDTQRVRRGRWLADRKANAEWYAEKMEHAWTQEVVVPYILRTYPKEALALRRWVAHRGGLLLPMSFFSGDTRRTERNGLERLAFTTSSAFENWVEELPCCATLAESRLAFAWELHYADHYNQCLAVLDRLLHSLPTNVQALTCKADTLVHLERLNEAMECAESALRLAPTNADAWETRGDVFENRQDWNGLLANCSQWEAAGKLRRPALRELWMHRAIAHCALGHSSEMEACLQTRLGLARSQSEEVAKRSAIFLRKSVFRRAGQPIPEPQSPSQGQ